MAESLDDVFEQLELVDEHQDRIDDLVNDALDTIEDVAVDELGLSADVEIVDVEAPDRVTVAVTPHGANLAGDDKPVSMYLTDPMEFVISQPTDLDIDKSLPPTKKIKSIIETLAEKYDHGVPKNEVLTLSSDAGLSAKQSERLIDRLKQKGDIYEPKNNRLRIV